MAGLLKTVKDAESKLNEAKAALRAAMSKHGVKKYDFGSFSASISASSVTSRFNTKQFKEDHPELYEKYVTKGTTQGSLTIKLKDND